MNLSIEIKLGTSLAPIAFNRINDSDQYVADFINKLLIDCALEKISDIHFESYEKEYRIRVRLSGVLYEKTKFPVEFAPRIAAYLKVLANLDITERRKPQDGRFKLQQNHQIFNFRISTCPTLFGERIVLRLCDAHQIPLNPEALGMNHLQKNLFLNALQKQHGLVVVTGPTGSGKTVTLFTALNLLNLPENNILTVEDPVEIVLPGLNQTNVNQAIGNSFAKILCAYLRQDPDIIMIGEIRDLETASIAIKASQTGHLVLTTLHTTNAIKAIGRLINIGIQAHDVAASISLIIAQRIIRKLCEHCRIPTFIEKEKLLELGFHEAELSDLQLYSPKGCIHCNQGFNGCTGIYELFSITNEIEDIILKKGTEHEILNEANQLGFRDLKRSFLDKAKNGLVCLSEMALVI